jgi:hypothetical protein
VSVQGEENLPEMEFQDSFILWRLWQSAACLLKWKDWEESESILKCKAKLRFRYILPIHGSVVGEREERNAHTAEHDIVRGCRLCSLNVAQPHCPPNMIPQSVVVRHKNQQYKKQYVIPL